VGWSAASAAALLTHYFAALVVVPEVVWLFLAAPARRPVLVAALPPAITGAALIPLIVEQSEQAGGGEPEATALSTRVAQFPKQLLVGYDIPLEVPLAIAGGAMVLVSLWLVIARAEQDARRGAQVAGVIAVSGALILLFLAVIGADYFLTRYLTVLLVPLSVVLAAGFAAVPRGLYAAGGLAVVFLVAVIAVQTDAKAQRPDLRGALEPLGDPPPGGRVVYITSITRIDVYLPGARFTHPEGEEVQEAVVVGLSVVGADTREDPSIDVRPPADFKLVDSTGTDSYERLRFRAPESARASPLELLDRPPGSVPVAFYYQPG
jgi:mannosyltransferase